MAAAVAMPVIGAPSFASAQGLNAAMRSSIGPAIGYFTPAAADPKLSAIYGRGQAANRGFRFTPAVALDQPRSVTVAVRANRFIRPTAVTTEVAPAAPVVAQGPALASTSYTLGSSIGWKRFAAQGDSQRPEAARLPQLDSGKAMPQLTRKWSTRVQLEADRLPGQSPRTYAGSENLSVDVGGAFRLARNLDVTAGVRYKSDRDRLQKAADDRLDSQAVYVGTAFRF